MALSETVWGGPEIHTYIYVLHINFTVLADVQNFIGTYSHLIFSAFLNCHNLSYVMFHATNNYAMEF